MLYKYLICFVLWAIILYFFISKGYKDGVNIRAIALKEAKEEFMKEMKEKEELNK